MPLTQDQEDREDELRVDQMTVNIENMRYDLLSAQKQLDINRTSENRRFGVSLVVGAAACVGAGVALVDYLNSKAPAPPPQIIYIQPPPASQTPPALIAAPQ